MARATIGDTLHQHRQHRLCKACILRSSSQLILAASPTACFVFLYASAHASLKHIGWMHCMHLQAYGMRCCDTATKLSLEIVGLQAWRWLHKLQQTAKPACRRECLRHSLLPSLPIYHAEVLCRHSNAHQYWLQDTTVSRSTSAMQVCFIQIHVVWKGCV